MAKETTKIECVKLLSKGFDISHCPKRIDYHVDWYYNLLTENEKHNLKTYGKIKNPN